MKKIFTVLLLAVFMLAQFSMASAATVAGDASITAIPNFSKATTVNVDWTATGMAAGTKNILMWARRYPAATYAMTECQLVATINGTSDANGSYAYDFTTTALGIINGDQIEFTITVDSANCAGAPDLPAAASVMGVTYIDLVAVNGILGGPPSKSAAALALDTASCNTFEYWSLVTDDYFLPAGTVYSGFDKWVTQVTGTFAPPAPEGPTSNLLEWKFIIPATASGPWSANAAAYDKAGNTISGLFRLAVNIVPAELEDCADFTDTAGHADETYIRYLADLGLISGFADGSFGPDNTLTRAEAATLFEISNGVSDTDPGFGTPPAAGSACDFSDVTATDWFAGWVWQACADGYMNGVGGGLFDPNNLLTRGQIVTIMNNVANTVPSGGFLNTANVINTYWGFGAPFPLREAAWTDVPVGAYYAASVVEAYGLGVADGTSENTFSPDQPVTRGVFAKMLYRALSRH